MAIKKRTTKTKSRTARSTRTVKAARVAKPRTARTATGRRRSTKNTRTAGSARARTIVVHRPRKASSSRGVVVPGINGFSVKVEGVKGVVHSVWMFGN